MNHQTSPEYVFPPVSSSALLDVLPNPSDRPELVAVLSQDGQAFMLNLNTKTVTAQFGSNITAGEHRLQHLPRIVMLTPENQQHAGLSKESR